MTSNRKYNSSLRIIHEQAYKIIMCPKDECRTCLDSANMILDHNNIVNEAESGEDIYEAVRNKAKLKSAEIKAKKMERNWR